MANSNPRIVIIGAGIVGASIAYNLSLRDADVTVVDASSPGMAASHASYAWINARPKLPRSYHDLNCRSMDVWSRWGPELAPFVEAGLLVRTSDRLRLTRSGTLLANEVMQVFVS